MILNRSRRLEPDFYFDTIADIPGELLTLLGIRLLICDIDNTLVTYDDPEPTPQVLAFFTRMQGLGISICFLSNNNRERVTRFNAALGYPAIWDAGKPLAGNAVKALLAQSNCSAKETMFVGDQIFTDLLTARKCRLPCILVKPIKDKTTLFFRFKRWMEKPFIASFLRKYGNNSQKAPEILALPQKENSSL